MDQDRVSSGQRSGAQTCVRSPCLCQWHWDQWRTIRTDSFVIFTCFRQLLLTFSQWSVCLIATNNGLALKTRNANCAYRDNHLKVSSDSNSSNGVMLCYKVFLNVLMRSVQLDCDGGSWLQHHLYYCNRYRGWLIYTYSGWICVLKLVTMTIHQCMWSPMQGNEYATLKLFICIFTLYNVFQLAYYFNIIAF